MQPTDRPASILCFNLRLNTSETSEFVNFYLYNYLWVLVVTMNVDT